MRLRQIRRTFPKVFFETLHILRVYTYSLLRRMKFAVTTETSGKNLIACFPLIRHEPYRKQRVQQFIYYFMCILCRGSVFTETLPSSDKRFHIVTYLWSWLIITGLNWMIGFIDHFLLQSLLIRINDCLGLTPFWQDYDWFLFWSMFCWSELHSVLLSYGVSVSKEIFVDHSFTRKRVQ
jgi:hypothetical protein